MSNEFYLTAPCVGKRSCGARVGEKCVDKRGNVLAPSQSHKARKDEYEHRQAAESATATLQSLEPVVDEEKARKVFFQEQREERIEKVLFAINFSRLTGIPQAIIDRNLAEMVVDGAGWIFDGLEFEVQMR